MIDRRRGEDAVPISSPHREEEGEEENEEIAQHERRMESGRGSVFVLMCRWSEECKIQAALSLFPPSTREKGGKEEPLSARPKEHGAKTVWGERRAWYSVLRTAA